MAKGPNPMIIIKSLRFAVRSAFAVFVSVGALVLCGGTLAQSAAPSAPSGSFGLDVKTLGAYGDCKHDDTVALQSAVGQLSGRTLHFPAGCYLITQPIRIPFAVGFRIVGEGQTGTKIQQQTDNTPIFVFTQELTHSWEVRDLEFAWAKPQPSQNTNSVAILFSTTTSSGGGLFNFTLSHLTFDNGYRGIYLGPGNHGALPVWGFVIEGIVAQREMSGATINLGPVPGTGMPRCILRDIYSQQASSEPQVTLHHCTSGTVDNIEDNNGVDTSLDLSGNWAMSVRAIHIEMHHMLHPNHPVISAENSKIDFEGVSVYIWSEVPGDYYLFSNVAGGGTLSIRNVALIGTAPETNRPSATNSPDAHSHLLRLNGAVKLLDVEGVDLNHADISRKDDSSTSQKLTTLARPPQ
jgi:hypothetical protein